jgi:uncharacterized membrane protein
VGCFECRSRYSSLGPISVHIVMNLVLSMQSAYTAPIIMMSQNRQAERDRLEAHNDYIINRKAEEEIRAVMNHLETQAEALIQIYQTLDNQKTQANGSAP